MVTGNGFVSFQSLFPSSYRGENVHNYVINIIRNDGITNWSGLDGTLKLSQWRETDTPSGAIRSKYLSVLICFTPPCKTFLITPKAELYN